MPKGDKLTPKQRKWAVEYLMTDNASEAARKAGYGARERGVENVSKRIHEKFLEELGDTEGALQATTPDALFAKLMKLIDTAEQEGTQMRGLELAMRAKRMFVEVVETRDGTVSALSDRLKQVQDPELRATLGRILQLDDADTTVSN